MMATAARAIVTIGLVLATAGCGGDDDSGSAPLRILVTNDDGYAAEGIDAIVEALAADGRNEVVVAAPLANRSGSSDFTGPSERCGDLTVTSAATLSGYPATAINGCPADAVNYALATLYPPDAPPHVTISGINEGQNISRPVATRLSGTVGAARTSARRGVPAIAASQGIPAAGDDYDYPRGVEAVLEWLERHRDGLAAKPAETSGGIIVVLPPTDITNINVPSCAPGSSVRGTFFTVPLAASAVGVLDVQDCNSTLPLEEVDDDVEAFRNGFITWSRVPLQND
jgi:5'-nucleotidase